MTLRIRRTLGRARVPIGCLLSASLLLAGCATTGDLRELLTQRDGSESVLERYREIRAREAAEAEAASEPPPSTSVAELISQGDRYRDAGELATALFTYLRAHQKGTAGTGPGERIAFIHLRNDPARAETIFRELLGQGPASAGLHMGLAISLLGQGDVAGARQELSRAVALEPGAATPRALLGVVLDRLGEHAAAQTHYAAAHRLRPSDAMIVNNLGVSQMLSGDLPAAARTLRQAVKLGRRDAALHNNLALALGLMGRYEEAFAEFARVGSEAEAHNNLGYILHLKGENLRALSHLERALDVPSESLPTVLQNIERVRAALGSRAPELGFEAVPVAGIEGEVVAGEEGI